ncbi:MAG: DUF1538 domain-containing protein [Pseudomonadota bacterium]|nr:DUF1538 domain-containing protein [Pseudomonadota bacterium]
MANQYRFGDYQRESGGEHEVISLDDVIDLRPKLERDAEGSVIPYQPPPVQLTIGEALKLLSPYVSVRFMEQVKSVVPLGVYLALFQILFLQQVVEDSWVITAGLFAVIAGLMFFMEGLKLGLMPFGTIIGSGLPGRSPLPVVLFVTLLLGIGVTFAEPAIGALQAAGQNVSVERAPYLYALLNFYATELVLVVGFSVGCAAVLGTLRFLYAWSLKPLIYLSLVPVLTLTLYCSVDPDLRNVIGLAWDCGAVTTGPVTVPLVLALGIGIAAAAGKGDSELSGFGIVTLASLFPVIGVFLLSLFVSYTVSPAEIIETARQAAETARSVELAWYERSPGEEIILGVRAILPLVLYLYFVLRIVMREELENRGEILYGISLTIVGMCIFNLGLTYGLSKLGANAGGLVPAAFMQIPAVPESPIYVFLVGLILALAFAWFLGFGATVAEPALNALGITTEKLTNGVFKKKSLIKAVSVGVAFGIAIGLTRLIFDWPLVWLLVPGYLLTIVLTFFSTEEFVNIAWDSAGVTTGPITVPLVLATGLGFGNATNAVEGFGILCMASVGPILAVLITGLWTKYKARALAREKTQTHIATTEEEAKALI